MNQVALRGGPLPTGGGFPAWLWLDLRGAADEASQVLALYTLAHWNTPQGQVAYRRYEGWLTAAIEAQRVGTIFVGLQGHRAVLRANFVAAE